MTEKKYILAHDTGTGGNKAVLAICKGQVLYSAYQSYGISYPQPEWVEQDPDELWRAVAATSRQVIQESGIDPAEILGVGVSAQMWNTLPVDEKGQPLTPMLCWLDLRSVKQADRVMSGRYACLPFQAYRQHSHRQGQHPEDPVAERRTTGDLESDGLSAGLQGIHPVQADRQDRH